MSVTSQVPAPGQRPQQQRMVRSAGVASEWETTRFRVSPSQQPHGTELGSSSSGSATWLDLAGLQQEEEDGEAVVGSAVYQGSSPLSQPHRAQPILTMGQ